MALIQRSDFVVSAEAQLAMSTYGISNPVDVVEDFAFDDVHYQAVVDSIRSTATSLQTASRALPQTGPATWTGEAAVGWDACENKFVAVLLAIADFLVWFVEALVWFLDVIIELIRWLGTVIDWVLGLLTVIGAIELALQHFGVRVPAWVRSIFKFLKLVEKAPKLIITIIAAAAWLISKLAHYIDDFLDWAREGLGDFRQDIAGCLGAAPKIEDEPIEPPDWM